VREDQGHDFLFGGHPDVDTLLEDHGGLRDEGAHTPITGPLVS